MSIVVRHRVGLALALGLGAVALCCGGPSPGRAGNIADPLLLEDLSGRAFDPLESSAAVILFLFVRTDCPISNRYAPELRRLHDRFAAEVQFWMVYPDPDEAIPAIRRHVSEYDLPGRAARDPQQLLVRRTGATVTPEAAVFAAGEMVYLGRIDDRFVAFGKTRAAATSHDLADALQAVLDGIPVPESRTRAIGCFIPELK